MALKFTALHAGRFYIPERYLVAISGRDCVDPKAKARPENLSRFKHPVT
jgi:hypothetical protein